MGFFERNAVEASKSVRTKVFLLTTDYTSVAGKMYIDRGYVKVCEMPGLFRAKITEKLYMKVVKNERKNFI